MGSHEVRLARVYDEVPGPDGGHRVLIDRLWPRGISREAGAFDEWCKDVAPSTELRRWYGHDPARFDEFAQRYRAELDVPPASAEVERLLGVARSQPITLVTATRDVDLSAARVLRDRLAELAR
jgi:uncharacterized protein YeaO (DUF488 family)